ncbi:MAG TPA: hypothetical protein VEW74_01850 [Candidatus Nitrosotalea sp.]|nr:hypothetical protein [Candidatus Nitrosotalea sp.]
MVRRDRARRGGHGRRHNDNGNGPNRAVHVADAVIAVHAYGSGDADVSGDADISGDADVSGDADGLSLAFDDARNGRPSAARRDAVADGFGNADARDDDAALSSKAFECLMCP